MKILQGLLAGIADAAVGLAVTAFAAAGIAKLLRMSDREGAAGYFAIAGEQSADALSRQRLVVDYERPDHGRTSSIGMERLAWKPFIGAVSTRSVARSP